MPKNIYVFQVKIINGGESMNSDALVNAILSFVIPGLGQAINGYKKKGIIMFIIIVILAVLVYYFNFGLIGEVVLVIFQLYSAYDAYITY